jgi:hypothetical protein
MDAIKKFLKSMSRYQFWLLSGLVLIASVAVFVVTKLSLDKLIATRVTALDEAHKKITGVSGAVPTHPNSYSHQELDKIVNVLKDEVKDAWEMQYKRQAPLLVWPEKAFPQNKQAIEIFRKMRPIEQYVEFPIAPNTPEINKITEQDREVFRRYIAPEFANVSKIIGTEWKATIERGMGAGGYGGEMGMGMGMGNSGAEGGEAGFGGAGYGGTGFGGPGVGMAESKDLVRWSKESQQQLLLQILPWYSRRNPPTVLDIYYTQEDMWLLTGLMEIIRATNAGAVENFQTKVREIEWIRMGRHANRDAGTLAIGPRTGGGGSMMPGGEGGEMGMPMGGEMESTGGPPGMAEGESMGEGGMGMGMGMGMGATVDPADNRYLSFAPETEFTPVTGVQLREAIKNINAGNAVDAVVRRVPIRMRLKIDPNHLSTLIAECGNANLMLEVYQVRLNTAPAPASGTGGYGGGYGGEGGGGKGMGIGGELGGGAGAEGEMGGMGSMGSEYGGGSEAGYGGGGGYGGGYGGMPGAPGAMPSKAMSEVPVEIYGLIYLYNPVNMGPLVDAPLESGNATSEAGSAASPALPSETQPSNIAPASNEAAADTNASAPPAPTPNPQAPAESNAAVPNAASATNSIPQVPENSPSPAEPAPNELAPPSGQGESQPAVGGNAGSP